MASATAYITTPIYYCNDVPHIGHLYSTTLCDVYARFMRFAGRDVFFLTGTDEHGIKVEKAARERGVAPQELADENSAVFRQVLTRFQLTNDDFIRTTQPRHQRQVQAFVKRLLESGAVYLGEFEGWYDEGQEEYYTETKAKELGYVSPVNRKPLVRAKEKNYYFRLSAYQKTLEELFARQPDFVRPEARRNEVLGRLREGLQDVPVSRTNFTWGIPFPPPAEPGHTVYVWVDALFNYITALGLGAPPPTNGISPAARDPSDDATDHAPQHAPQRAVYWPATYHVIGKEILWFHAVIWPALLTALNLPLPRCIYAHSFWISEGQKMSKSLGNFIDLDTIERYLQTYGLDAWRYYLVTQGPLGATDANFTADHFHEIYTTDLVNTVGNCASRVTAMIGKYFEGKIPQEGDGGQRTEVRGQKSEVSGKPTASASATADFNWPAIAEKAVRDATGAYERFDLPGGISAAMALLRKVDGFINATEPFKIAKDESRKDELGAILYQCLEAVRIASLLLWPALPGKMEELWNALNLSIAPGTGVCRLAELASWGGLKPGSPVQKVALFPRVDQSTALAASPVPG